ncbi:hypothetical protein LTR56_023666 [Elasticomyces elasticus]|nr:hypothetical protein LTR56_023666 [Elasticomyces elasticus]KAK3624986.1 hypothetical protein LTR22_023735 [Elasticomyces elasticus]KAK4906583.1 hypothetical protein LTR49_024279 [Elasticomyces elasticus]KAK5768107.1 hypothetical protein LTS12_001591 [Elasticomyces elasticus]
MIGCTATQSDSGTIYYLQTSTPHLYDTSISGPYHNLDAIAAQIERNFGAECQPGTQYLDEMLEAGMEIMHVTSPMLVNGNPNLTKTARILRETNPTMLAQLPGPAWYIVVAEIAVEIAAMGSSDSGASMPLEDAQVHGTYGAETSANDAARQLAQTIATRERGTVAVMPGSSCFRAGIMCRQDGSPQLTHVVHVQHDRGAQMT